jgi:hypothetical protein
LCHPQTLWFNNFHFLNEDHLCLVCTRMVKGLTLDLHVAVFEVILSDVLFPSWPTWGLLHRNDDFMSISASAARVQSAQAWCQSGLTWSLVKNHWTFYEAGVDGVQFLDTTNMKLFRCILVILHLNKKNIPHKTVNRSTLIIIETP